MADNAQTSLHGIISATSQSLHLGARAERAEEHRAETSPALSGSPESSSCSTGNTRNVPLPLQIFLTRSPL